VDRGEKSWVSTATHAVIAKLQPAALVEWGPNFEAAVSTTRRGLFFTLASPRIESVADERGL